MIMVKSMSTCPRKEARVGPPTPPFSSFHIDIVEIICLLAIDHCGEK